MHAGIWIPPRLEQHLLDRIIVALVIALHLAQQLHARIGALAPVLAFRHLRGKRLQPVVQRLHAQIVIRGLRLQFVTPRLLGLQMRRCIAHLLVQRIHARLLALAVARHALKLVFQRGLHCAEPRPLRAHVAQAIHRLNDLLLHLLRARLELSKRRLRRLERLLLRGKRLRIGLQPRIISGNARLQRLNALGYALAPPARSLALLHKARAFLFTGGNAFAHHAHRALLRLHLADQCLHLFALFGGAQLQTVQRFLTCLALRARSLHFTVGLQDRFTERFYGFAQLAYARLVALRAHQKYVDVQRFELVAQRKVFARLLALLFQRLYALLKLGQDVLHAREVLRGIVHAALRVVLARLVLHDARGFLEYLAAILGLGGEYLVDSPLPDHGIAVSADAGIAEQIHNIAQAAGRAVDLVFALAAAIDAPRDRDLGKINGQRMIRVVKDQRYLAKGQALALFSAAEDHVLHLRTAQRFGALLAQHPLHGVRNVALAAAVRAHHAGNAVLEHDLNVICKGLKAVYDQFLQSQLRLRSHSLECIPRGGLLRILFAAALAGAEHGLAILDPIEKYGRVRRPLHGDEFIHRHPSLVLQQLLQAGFRIQMIL